MSSKQTMGFQTEAKRLLQLMIHSLYSNREIFLRELISNASDAIDKRRFQAIEDSSLDVGGEGYQVRVDVDEETKTLTISDNGIGMSREDIIENLGTIAKSGTAAFMEQLSGDQQKDSQLIGQFGVGFYSSFIVADRVEVISRKAGSDEATRWESTGEDEFSIDSATRDDAGTTVILHLDGEAEEFASPFRVRSVIKKYSDHISVPVLMLEQAPPVDNDNDNDDEDAVPASPAWERVNEAKALWTRSRSEVSDEEYKEFYRHVSSDYQEPLSWGHNRVEGKLDYTSLLYLPSQAPFDLWNRDGARGLKLYIQRTFIMDDAEQFLPLYLRFVKGVLDSQDLPLNISREILQQSPQVDSLRSAVTKRVLDMLGKMGKSDPDKYQTFWNVFGNVLKEGPGEDFVNREKIAELLRFASTDSDDDTQNVSLPSYVSRMQEGQNAIYYVVADNHVTAKNSPHIEVFRKKGIEVLLLSDRIDDWLMGHLNEFDGKALKDIAKGELDLGESTDEEKAELEAAKTDNEGLLDRLKEALGGRISEVRPTLRLTDSPACLVVGEHELGAQMRSILEAAGQELPDSQPILEVNTDHGLVKRMDSESDEDRFADLALILLDQATLAQGSQLEDPASYVSRMNRLLVEMSA